MLVMTRKQGQDIFIEHGGKVILVRVIRLFNNKVQIGVGADRDVTVVRGEILDKYPLACDEHSNGTRKEGECDEAQGQGVRVGLPVVAVPLETRSDQEGGGGGL